ncbi:MAG: hypothetical protein ACJ798_07535 [Phenylobacterium sp.]
MNRRAKRRLSAVAALSVLAAASVSLAPLAAFAKDPPLVSRSHSITATVTVKAVDKATRHLTLTNSAGETWTAKAPAELKRFDSLKPGDKVKVAYQAEVEIALSAPGQPLPSDAAGVIAVRNAEESPAGGLAGSYLTVTGAVLAIDMAKHTIKIVNPQGGEVHLIEITREDGQKAMARLKVGDKITARVTESLVVSVAPA